jgi:hypothetical protein
MFISDTQLPEPSGDRRSDSVDLASVERLQIPKRVSNASDQVQMLGQEVERPSPRRIAAVEMAQMRGRSS